MKQCLLWACAWIGVLGIVPNCCAIFANIGKDVPVERLVDNLQRYVAEHPGEAHGYYLLGRVHSMAFAKQITPVLVGAGDSQRLDELLDELRTVPFDLDGTGRGHRWPWVEPDVGILVWDPQNTGQVTSGRQLFGSVTWWLFWDDGYAALAALDGDGDGSLNGGELAGIAVWSDRNGNGVSDAGEVQSARQVGIVRIAATCRRDPAGVLSNPAGVELEDGEVLPTFDWTPTSVPSATTESR